MKLKCVVTILLLSGNFFLTRGQGPASAARDVYDWRAYDNSASTVKKDAIDFRMLQGVWAAYQGWYYGDDEKFWKDYNNPRKFEIRGNQMRTGSYGSFKIYKLKGNLISYETENKIDSAYINLITTNKLTISFKRGKDFEKYMFEK